MKKFIIKLSLSLALFGITFTSMTSNVYARTLISSVPVTKNTVSNKNNSNYCYTNTSNKNLNNIINQMLKNCNINANWNFGCDSNSNNNNNNNNGNNENNGNSGNNENENNENLPSNVSDIEKEVARLVNVERQKNGLNPLTLDASISSVARLKSQDMIDKNYFNHQSPTYGSPFDMLRKFGINYQYAGENIAMGQRTAQEVMNGWMNSPGHRANILSSNYGKIGVGYAVKNGTAYWTQMFTN